MSIGATWILGLAMISPLAIAASKHVRKPAEGFTADAPVAVGMEPGLDLSELKKRGYTVAEEPQAEPSEMLAPNDRDALLARVGFTSSELSGFDELALDMLVMRAKHRSFSRLQETYPKLSAEKLERLQQALLAK